MKKRFNISLLLFVLFTVYGGGSYGNSGFDFLRSDMGARSSAIGGATVAIKGDLHGLMTNPAGLVSTREREITFSYIDHLVDIKSGFIGFGKSLRETGRLGIGISYIHYGEFERTDIVGTSLGSFTSYDYAFSIAYANTLPYGFCYGLSVKYIQSRIDHYLAGGVAVDFGLIYRIDRENLNIGFSVLNLGRATKSFIDVHEKFPISYRIGFSKVLAHLPLMLNFDLIKYQYDQSSLFWGVYWALGGEFTITDFFFLRWGYHSRGREERIGSDNDWSAGISLGIGIQLKRYRLDYGFSGHGALGSKNFFTVTIPF